MEFSPRKTKSKEFCSVFGCSSTAQKHETVRFFHFPKSEDSLVKVQNFFGESEFLDRRKAWKNVLKMGKAVSDNMLVCSLHFLKEDFYVASINLRRETLLKTAVPSLNLPVSTVDTKTLSLEKKLENDARSQRAKSRSKMNMISEEATSNCLNEIANPIPILGENSLNNCCNYEKDWTLSTEQHNSDCVDVGVQVDSTETTEIGIQVKSGDLCSNNFFDDIVSDKDLSTLTGIEKIAILDTLVKIDEMIAPRFQFYNAKLTIRQRIIMCFMKLKHNLSYALLAFLFKSCSERHCQNVILNMIDILNYALQFAIVFPSKEEIYKNLPTCFEDFKTTRIVLDCTEINMQKPKNLCSQLATYSFYKGTHTVKYMTGATPGGLISFVSKGYGGRASDKAIFEQSGLLELMKEEDGSSNKDNSQCIMVDKGFLIDDKCRDYGVKLIRPPFVKNKTQFSEEDALNTYNIASARVHVERDNQRLESFRDIRFKNAIVPCCKM